MTEITGQTLIEWGFKPGSWFKDALKAAQHAANMGASEETIQARSRRRKRMMTVRDGELLEECGKKMYESRMRVARGESSYEVERDYIKRINEELFANMSPEGAEQARRALNAMGEMFPAVRDALPDSVNALKRTG